MKALVHYAKPAGICAVVALLFGLLWFSPNADYFYYLPPLFVNALLLFGFGRTLLPGRVPLISRLAADHHGPLDSKTARYTRRVTQMWALFFAAMIVETVLLQQLAPRELGSLVAGLVNYSVVIALFLLEFWWRRRCLPQIEHPSFIEYLRYLRPMPWRGAKPQ